MKASKHASTDPPQVTLFVLHSPHAQKSTRESPTSTRQADLAGFRAHGSEELGAVREAIAAVKFYEGAAIRLTILYEGANRERREKSRMNPVTTTRLPQQHYGRKRKKTTDKIAI